MPGSPDPSLWQDFVKTIATGIAAAVGIGWGIHKGVMVMLQRIKPETRADAELKSNLEAGVIKQIAHDLASLRKGQQDLRERVVRIETILERKNGA